jgi:hypothetical protein
MYASRNPAISPACFPVFPGARVVVVVIFPKNGKDGERSGNEEKARKSVFNYY